MEELKTVVADNMIRLRTAAGMKQAELAEKINYSDKSVSKWERAEALPDVMVLKNMAEIFGVTVDYFLQPHGEEETEPTMALKRERASTVSHRRIIDVTMMGIWALALLLFIIFWLAGKMVWPVFVMAAPVSLITLLVLHSLWGGGRYNLLIISALMISLLMLVYFLFLSQNWWQIFLLVLPLEIIIVCCFRIKTPRDKP